MAFGAGHTWQHLEEARVRLGSAGHMLGPELTHTMLNGSIPGIPLYLIVPSTALFLNAGRAKELDFSFALRITGPGGGIWAFRASDAGWQVEEVEAADTDLVLSPDLDTYIKTRYFMSDMMSLGEAGEIEASDDEAFSVYNRLSMMPDFDFEFPRMP